MIQYKLLEKHDVMRKLKHRSLLRLSWKCLKISSLCMWKINCAILYAQMEFMLFLFPNLDLSNIKNIGYYNTVFSNNSALSSQIRTKILCVIHSSEAIQVSFKNCKLRRVIRSQILYRSFNLPICLARPAEFARDWNKLFNAGLIN